jgi:hypothetical protein
MLNNPRNVFRNTLGSSLFEVWNCVSSLHVPSLIICPSTVSVNGHRYYRWNEIGRGETESVTRWWLQRKQQRHSLTGFSKTQYYHHDNLNLSILILFKNLLILPTSGTWRKLEQFCIWYWNLILKCFCSVDFWLRIGNNALGRNRYLVTKLETPLT